MIGQRTIAQKRNNAIKRTHSDRILLGVALTVVILVTACCLYPLLYVVSMSFSSDTAVLSNSVWLLPRGVNFRSYQIVLSNGSLLHSMLNTLLYTALGIAVSLILTVSYGYSLSRRGTFFNRFLQSYTLVCMIFSGGLIPFFILMNRIKLYGTIWSVIMCGALSVWNAILVRVFIRVNIPDSMYEAATIDGANEMQIFFRLVLPLSTTIIVIIGMYAGVHYWNDYFNALLFLPKRDKWPMQVLLKEILSVQSATSNQSIMSNESLDQTAYLVEATRTKYAIIVIATVPIGIVYPFLQKYFVKGVMIGAIKE